MHTIASSVNKTTPHSTNGVTLCARAFSSMIIFVEFCVKGWILVKIDVSIDKVRLGWVNIVIGKAWHSHK